MHHKGPLLLVCASLTLLASAAPQDAAATGAVAKSTLTQTMVATATMGSADPSAATGGASGADDADDTGADPSDVSDGGAAGAGAGSDAGTGVVGGAGAGTAGSGANGAGAGSAGTAGAPGAPSGGANSGMPPPSSGSGAGMSGSGPPSGMGPPNGEDWEKYFDGKGPGAGGDKGPAFWAKFAGSNGHPHQPVSRRWSNWFSGGAGKEQENEKGYDSTGMTGAGAGSGAGGYGQGHSLHARGNTPDGGHVVNGGPSWNHIRFGELSGVKVARSMPMGGQGQGGQPRGGMSYSGERQGGSRWGGYGQ